MSEDLQKLRAQMDGIDNEIARLLKDRAATAIEIGRQKKSEGELNPTPILPVRKKS